jgi:hypothetical protein
MTQDSFDFAGTYAAMEDEELLEIARDSSDLVDAARKALQQEIAKRGLKLGPPKVDRAEVPDSMFYCSTCGRAIDDPLTCGECATTICRVCGTPLKMPEDLDTVTDEEGEMGGTEREERIG